MRPGPVGSSGHGPAPSTAPVGRKTVGIAGPGRTQHPSLSVDSPHTCSKGTPPISTPARGPPRATHWESPELGSLKGPPRAFETQSKESPGLR